MSLVSMIDSISSARKDGYAVPCFDVFDAVSAEGMLEAAEERKSPVILAFYDHFVSKPNARALAAFIKTQAEQANVPVSLMVDHGKSVEVCVRALEIGFTDVMIDGSSLPLDENIALTLEVVDAAHAAGAGCEAEIGHVGGGGDYDTFGAVRKGFSDPDEVERFVRETGVDCVAIAIGTAHGQYNAPPNIDVELLAAIRGRVDIPLVLHGGSGLADEQFRSAINGGISKINIFTELARASAVRVAEAIAEKPNYFGVIDALRESFREGSASFMDIFGSSERVRI